VTDRCEHPDEFLRGHVIAERSALGSNRRGELSLVREKFRMFVGDDRRELVKIGAGVRD